MSTGKTVLGEVSSEMSVWLSGRTVTGKVHSVFSKAVNVVCPEQMISVLSAETLREPMSVRLAEKISFTSLGVREGYEVSLSRRGLTIGALHLPLDLVERWEERHPIQLGGMPECAERACRFLTDYLQNFAQPVGMAVLFHRQDKSLKEQYMVEKANGLLHARGEAETLSAMRGLAGLGPGLTPAGDDFLSGFIRTQLLFGTRIDYTALVKKVGSLTNDLSAKSLELAAEGRCAEEISLLLYELLDKKGNYVKAISHMNAVAAYGSSSGTDILCGICVAIKKELAEHPVKTQRI